MKLRIASAALVAGLLVSAAPHAMAQAAAPTGPIVAGIGIADLPGVLRASNAYRNAAQQRQNQYKPQIDQAKTRAQQIQAQIDPLVAKFDADRKAANPNEAALRAQYQQIQQIQQSGQEEINRILQPIQLSEAYVEEQVSEQIGKAVQQASAKRKISIVLPPDGVVTADKAYDMSQDVLTELNTLFPAAQLVPPAGWMPRAQREQAAAQAAAAGQQAPAAAAPAAAAPAGKKKQPEGR